MTNERRYSKPRPRFWTLRFALMLVPFVAGVTAAFLRTGAAANLVSYWGYREAWAVAICIETADLAFLLRVVWLHAQERDDWVSWAGAILAMSASIAFSVMLGMVYGDRFGLLANVTGQVATAAASIGINLTTYALARELAAYVVDHERADAEWIQSEAQWQNQRAARAERAVQSAQVAPQLQPKLQPVERQAAMLQAIHGNPALTTAELVQMYGVSEKTVYNDIRDLATSGQLHRNGDGTYSANGHRHD